MASEIIKLNLIPKGEMPVFHCSQFDNGRLITIELYRGEDAYEVPAGYTVELHCRKVDNNIVTLASTLVNTNVVTFTSTTQLTACNGKNLCEVAIKAADDYLIGTLNFWLEVEMDPLKGGINSTSEIHDLYEQIEDITAEVIGDDYYDKTEVDNLLDTKADKSTTYTKTQVDTLLTAKADKSNVYTKAETNTLLSTKADADNVYTKAQVETKLAAKADAASVYTKGETDALLDTKANAATTYTKTEVDTALTLKANAADVYTKAETDAAIEAAIEDILPVDTAGPSAIANFTTGLALPLVECEVGIVATGGNGTPDNPNPINGYTEANIINVSNYENYFKGLYIGTYAFIDLGSLTYIRSTSYNNPFFYANLGDNKHNGDSIISNDYMKTTGNASSFGNNAPDKSYAIGQSSYQLFVRDDSYSESTTFKNAMSGKYLIYELATATTPTITPTQFNTLCTAFNATGTLYTIAFGQTVYGGVLDVTRGKLHVTDVYDTLDGTELWVDYAAYNGFRLTLADMKSGNFMSGKANFLQTLSAHGHGIRFGSDNTIIYCEEVITDIAEVTDLASWKTYLSNNNLVIVYPLATPFDIDLTPVQISALVGENNVFGDTNGNTTVKFKDTIQNYIDKKVNT